jgi:hypothetical protein
MLNYELELKNTENTLSKATMGGWEGGGGHLVTLGSTKMGYLAQLGLQASLAHVVLLNIFCMLGGKINVGWKEKLSNL